MDVIASDGHSTEFQCDYEPVHSSVLYVFVVRAHYPTRYKCRTTTCVQNFYSSIYYKLQTLTTVSLTSDSNITIPMNFCSIDEISDGHSNQSKKTTFTTTSASTTTLQDTTSTTNVSSTETSSPIIELSSIETEENTTGTTITQVTASSETISTLPVNSESSSTATTEISTVQMDETTISATVTQISASSETISTLPVNTESSTTTLTSPTDRMDEIDTSTAATQVTTLSETTPTISTSTVAPSTTTTTPTTTTTSTTPTTTTTTTPTTPTTTSTTPTTTTSTTTTSTTPTTTTTTTTTTPTTRTTTSTTTTKTTTSTTTTMTTTTTSISKPRYLYVLPSTIQGIWNAVAGGNSSFATALALGAGTYPSDRSPDQLFDDLNNTCYASRGNSIIGSNSIAGLNTGFYVSMAACSPVLDGFIIQTCNEDSSRDPIKITIEGSNKNSSLNLGSSWTLIYNGSTGLDTNPGRQTNGLYQTISNTNSYKNYRLLVTSKRGSQSDFVSYSAVKFYGHYIQLSISRSSMFRFTFIKLSQNTNISHLDSSSLLNVIASSAQAIWNTIAGRNSSTAISGSSGSGTYLSGSSPSNLFDNSTSTLYVSRGNLTSGTGANAGINTGFYVTVADCQAVLTGFSFSADVSRSNRDPTSVTIEGSNSDELTKGTSWQLLYSGPTGLRTTNRANEGDRQIVNNSISYLSYRFLITSRRSTTSDYVSYSEVKLYGYHA